MKPEELKALCELYEQQFHDGEITNLEFKELVGDLNISSTIAKNLSEFNKDINTRDYLVKVAQVALAIY